MVGYTSEKNNQIVLQLLKYHDVKKIIVSPGATNVSLVASMQYDSFFELYSCVDERSAAYMACGMSAESHEVVALCCTGATASRNYYPGLTEAYYRHLPILVLTTSMPVDRIGHNIPQVIDRSTLANDVAKKSYYIPFVKNLEDEWTCRVKVNEAILELKHHYTGPVHMNIETLQSGTFDCTQLPYVMPIDRFFETDNQFPEIISQDIAIFIGAHIEWKSDLVKALEIFCEKYNAVIIGDQTSNYPGKYFVMASLITSQISHKANCNRIGLLIHIGETSGAYLNIKPSEVWRVSLDGKICDTYKTLRYVFEMPELSFFQHYNSKENSSFEPSVSFWKEWKSEYDKLLSHISELPLSNIWIASKLSKMLPSNAVLHLGILNSLRSWNFFDLDKSIRVYSNTGGFGIDGCVSTLIGASIASPDKMFFGIVGDLAFFYDMNSIGNRHIGDNIRILVINNGHGQEFRNYGHRASQFGEDTDKYIAAAGHFGRKSYSLLKDYSTSLGFTYLSADNKENAEKMLSAFVSEKPSRMILEIFTENNDESFALEKISNLETDNVVAMKKIIKRIIRK